MLDRFIAGDGSGFLAWRAGRRPFASNASLNVPPARPAEGFAPNGRKEPILKAQEPARQPKNSNGSEDQPVEGLVFVDWDGRVYDLAMRSDTLAAWKKVSQDRNMAKNDHQDFMPTGTWQGPVVLFPGPAGSFVSIVLEGPSASSWTRRSPSSSSEFSKKMS